MSAQLHLFGAHRPKGSSALGLKIQLHTVCKCGGMTGSIGGPVAMHTAEVRCSNCLRFSRWLSKEERDLAMRLSKSPAAPDVLRLPSREKR
jgi:hypothetical protein